MAEAVPYDGLLLALNLPDGNGMEVVTELRDRTPYWGVPMVAVTAQALPEGDGSFLDRGLDAYVSTPVERTALRRLVRHFMVEADGALDKGRRLLHRSDAADRRAEGGRDASQGAPVTEQIEIPGGVDEPPTEEAA
jgi:DNA-binding response OmpR family regulator